MAVVFSQYDTCLRLLYLLKWYYDQIFTSSVLVVLNRISWKNKNAFYHLQISELVMEIFKFKKCAKYAN